MPTFKSTNPMEYVEADEYILNKTQEVNERRLRRLHRVEMEYKHNRNIKRKARKQERKNRKGGRR